MDAIRCYETVNSKVEAGWSSLMTRPLGSLRAFDMFIQTRKLTSWLGAGRHMFLKPEAPCIAILDSAGLGYSTSRHAETDR